MGRSGDYGPTGDYPRQGDDGWRQGPPAVPPQFQEQGWQDTRQQPYAPQYQPRPQQYQPPQPQFTQWPQSQYQQPQYPPPQGYYPPSPQQKPPRKSRKGLAFLGCGGLGALVVIIAVVAASSSSSSSAPGAAPVQQQPAAPAQPDVKAAPKAAAAQTVTYVVTGSDADVTYGPAGTDLSGSVPMHVSKPLGTPIYYAITAQLQGGGTVSCKIEVDGKTISSSTASGGYNLATCEISQDPLSGNWSDTNG